MNSTTQPPAISDGDAAVTYVLVPFFLITIIGIAVAVVSFFLTQVDLLPIYSYDPSEELHEAEQEILWKEEDTRIVQSWARSYQQHRPLLASDVNA
uniref:Small integral membrane protein 29 n=1 Tax=Cynoglossus semilaevis TaxID=244447 RepID=A0A3P8WKH9_CYNSE